MRSLNLSTSTLENQRRAVLEEYRERVEQSPYGEAHGRITEISYESFGYGHPVIGYKNDLEAADLESISAFHRTWYGPENAVLAITGDVDPESTLDLVEEYFWDISCGEQKPVLSFQQEPRMLSVNQKIHAPSATLPAVFVNHSSVPYGNPDFFVYEVLETLLFRGRSSRLQRNLVADKGLALNLKGGYEAHRGPSLFSLFAILGLGSDVSSLVAAYFEELERLTREPVTDDELNKVRNQVAAARLFSQQSLIHRSNTLARSVMYHNDPHFEHRYLERLLRVQPDDILRVARRDFDPNAAVILEVEPG
jgi:zinc protease